MAGYILKLLGQSETEPLSLDEVRVLVQQKKVRGTTLVYTEDSQKWRLATSVRETRNLIREFDPTQDKVLDRLSSDAVAGNTLALLAKRRAKEKATKPLWKRLWPS